MTTDTATDMSIRRWPQRPAGGSLTVTMLGRGQSGKSTTVAALGDAVQQLTGWSTVLVDLDSTALMSKHLVPDARSRTVTTEQVLAGERAQPVALREGLGVVPAGSRLAEAEAGLPDAAVAQRIVLPLFAGGADLVLLDTQAMRPMVAGSAPLLRGAIDVADVVVIPFALGSKNVDHLELALGELVDYQRAADRVLPLLLLPTMAEAAQRRRLEAGVSLAGAVGRAYAGEGLQFLPSVSRGVVVQRSEYDHQLLAATAPEHVVTREYAVVAELLADVLAAVA